MESMQICSPWGSEDTDLSCVRRTSTAIRIRNVDTYVNLTNRLDGCYTRPLRKAKGWTYNERKKNVQLYGEPHKISSVVKKRQVAFVGYCARCPNTPQPVQHLVFLEAGLKFIRGKGDSMRMMRIIILVSVRSKFKKIQSIDKVTESKHHSQLVNAAPVILNKLMMIINSEEGT